MNVIILVKAKFILLIQENQDEEYSLNKLPYEDATEQLKYMEVSLIPIERRLNYSIDSKGIRHNDFFFERKLDEEIKYQEIMEVLTGYKVFLNPKSHTDGIRSPDFWIENTDELWDLKGIDGNSDNIIDNVLHNASRRFQAENLILKQRKTTLDIDNLKKQLKYIFDNDYKKKIRQVILFNRDDNVIVYYKR